MANKLVPINRGTTYTIQGFYEDEDGEAVDITGATVFFTIKNVEYDSDTDDSGATIVKNVTSFAAPTTGEYAIELAPGDTDGVTPDNYYYDISIKLADGTIHELDEGRVKIDASPRNRLAA